MPARGRRKNAARGTRTGVIQPGSTPGASQDQDDDPLAMSPIRRKKRRRKEVIDSYGAGPSGWNGLSLELGEHGDLVPPSDDEEFEQWKSARVRGGEGVALVEEQDVEGRVTDQVIVGDQDSPHQSALGSSPERHFLPLFLSPTPPAASQPLSDSHDTSPTIPLSFSQNPEDSTSLGFEDHGPFPAEDETLSLRFSMARDSDSKKRQWWHEFDVQVSPKDPVYPAPVGEQQDRVPGSTPFDDSQIGPRNAYLFQSPLRLRSSAATPEAIIDASPSAMRCQLPSDLSSPSTPSRPAASNVSSRHHAATDRVLAVFPRGPSSPHPLPPSPSRQTHRSQTSASPSLPVNPASLWRNAEYPPPPPVLPSPSPADPALEQFRTARTFRTRTVLQLQPYTKERQIYEAALRRGGLKKGKKAIADSCEIAREEEDHEEEGRHEESSEAQETPERLMIGGTPPSTAQRKPRSPKPLVKADFDEYFLEYGEVAEEDDPDIFEKLQTIARNRVKEQKEQRKKARAARIAKKRFEELLNHSADDTAAPVTGEKRPRLQKRIAVTTPRTPGRPPTYAKHDRAPRRVDPEQSSESDALPDLPPSLPDQIAPLKSSKGPASTPSQDMPVTDNVDIDMCFGQDSFFLDDLPQSAKRRTRHSSHSSSSRGSDASATPQDHRARIARRMMPAAMLKRLEREAVEQERRKVERRRHATRDSPIKPGKAVISRGQGGVNIQDLLENVASKEEVYEDAAVLSASRTPQPERQQQLIVVSEDESSQSSQAHEDNVGEQSLARLYDGDFESIVAGRHALDRTKWNEATMKRPRSKSHQKHPRRPALGLVKRIAMSLSKGDRGMMQTRLDFPVNDRSTVHYAKARKHKQKDGRRSRRPAIQLDDHIIFATTDFAFNTQEEEQRPGLPRPFKRTISKVISEPDALDNGIGKARSWANFDNFPIDFGISPLPSGLYCSRESLVGNGDLARLVALLQGRGSESEEVLGCSAYSVELRIDMTPGALSAVISMLFEGIGQSVVALANDPGADVPDLAPLTFFGRYFSSQASVSDDIDGMRSLCRPAVGKLSDKLNEVTLTGAKHSRSVRDWLIRLRWSILEMTMRLNLMASPDETIDDLVDVSGAAMIQQLLGGGFDKTIRPLKSILRSESGSPEVSDLSVTIWIAVIHSLSAWDQRRSAQSDTFSKCLDKALDSCFRLDQTGPIAAERIWFVVFGLSALSQFDVNGRIVANFTPAPRWSLVRRAVSLIKISHNEEAEEKAHLDQLRGRDRYIKTILARCVRLSSVWRWNFDRESFSVATKDLGAIFKDRQHRNLPTEPPVDYPDWVTSFDISLTAAEDTTQESAFELYLRSVCVAASDIISSARDMSEAQQAEKDVQRLIMSIIPVSPVKFHRILPPTSPQLGQLINRYSTMVAACYFSPSLLSWLLANSRKWAPFEHADFESRQISIRGLMYLSVTCRHHQQPLAPVVTRLADILKVLQFELDHCGKPSAPAQAPSRVEITRTMVLVVSCFRQMIIHHSFNAQQQAKHVYPDPCLLHESWTARVFALDLAHDHRCASEIVATIQAFLDARAAALPRIARQRREARRFKDESQDDYSFGIDFSAVDLAELGGEAGAMDDPTDSRDEEFAQIIKTVISPQIYRLLSDMLPAVDDETLSIEVMSERQIFIGKLTKCWSDCASVLVIEQRSPDGWTPFIGAFGRQSWQRLRSESGRLQVGLHFMLNVAKLDGNAFGLHEEDFISLLFQTIVTERLTIEHQYLTAVVGMPGALNHPLLAGLTAVEGVERELDMAGFMDIRGSILEAIFSAIPGLLRSPSSPSTVKAFVYRCVNLLVSSLIQNENSIDPSKEIHRESSRAFPTNTIRDLRRLAGDFITPSSVPGLKSFLQ